MRRVIESTLLSLDAVIGDPHVWASERLTQTLGTGVIVVSYQPAGG